MKLLYFAFSALIVTLCANHSSGTKINQVLHSHWKKLRFAFPTYQDRQNAIKNGNLVPENAMLIDVQPHYNTNKLFVTLPKFRSGTPFSLATINDDKKRGRVLVPYPNYAMHDNKNGTDCDAITSAFRVGITECDQMWVIDSGLVGSNNECPPQLLLFDLHTDKVIHRYRFNESVYIPSASQLMTAVVSVKDRSNNCKDTKVYVADVNYHGLVVYDYKENNAWRIDNRFLYPDPNYGVNYVAGQEFTLMDGIFGLVADKTHLYFHPYSSVTEYKVPLSVIDNRTLFENNAGNMIEAFVTLGKRKTPCPASAMDSKRNIYCVSMDPIKLLKWNVDTYYNEKNIEEICVRTEELQFVGGMKVVKNPLGEDELWMTSSKYQNMASGTRNFNEDNYFIVKATLENDNNQYHPHNHNEYNSGHQHGYNPGHWYGYNPGHQYGYNGDSYNNYPSGSY